jgi:hypothetical protein
MKNSSFGRLALRLVLTLIVAGCAGQNRQTQSDIPKVIVKKIAILPIKERRAFTLGNRIGPFAFLPGAGLWSGLGMAEKSKQFAIKMHEFNLTLGSEVTQTLSDNLGRHGFETVILTDNKVRANPENPADIRYHRIVTDADAILNVWIKEAGAFSVLSSVVYQPQLNLEVRLVSKLSEESLFKLSIDYGANSGKTDFDSIPSDPKYQYKDYDTIMGKLPELVEALHVGAQALADQIASQIRRSLK